MTQIEERAEIVPAHSTDRLGLTQSTALVGLLEKSGNPDAKFMQCLPAFHDRNTEVGEQLFQQTGLTALAGPGTW